MRIATIVVTGAALLIAGTPAMARHHHKHHHHAQKLDATSPTTGGSVNGPASKGAGTGENKPSATGGQPGGSAGQQ